MRFRHEKARTHNTFASKLLEEAKKKDTFDIPEFKVQTKDEIADERAKHLRELRNIVRNFESDEAITVLTELAKKYPFQAIEALKQAMSSIEYKAFQEGQKWSDKYEECTN